MTDNDQHLRDLQREYLDFLDDEVFTEIRSFLSPASLKTFVYRRTKESTPTKSKR